MNKFMTGALAASLSITFLAGCSTSKSDTSPSVSPSSPVVAPTAPSSTAPDSTTPSGSTSSTTAPTTGIDQSTPEAAMTSLLNAMGAGKGSEICSLTAVNGKRASDVTNGQQQCTKSLSSVSGSLKPLAGLLKGLTIKGATVKGDKADFSNAKTTPELAAAFIKGLKAIKIDGKWYVSTT